MSTLQESTIPRAGLLPLELFTFGELKLSLRIFLLKNPLRYLQNTMGVESNLLPNLPLGITNRGRCL